MVGGYPIALKGGYPIESEGGNPSVPSDVSMIMHFRSCDGCGCLFEPCWLRVAGVPCVAEVRVV